MYRLPSPPNDTGVHALTATSRHLVRPHRLPQSSSALSQYVVGHLLSWTCLLTILAIADICGVMWGPIGRELVGIMFLVAFVLCTGSGLLGVSIAFNALSEHATCTVWFSLVSLVLVVIFSSIRTWEKMTWPMTLAFASVMGGVLAVVIGVALRDRPAAAPAEGDFDLGFRLLGNPSFAAGITATATIFISSASAPTYIPIIAEMRRPQDYRKAVIPVGVIVGSIYLTVSLVVYYYCGQWIATPSLGSAGPNIKKVGCGQRWN